MRAAGIISLSTLVCIVAGLWIWNGPVLLKSDQIAPRGSENPPANGPEVWRLGLVPERDVFAQRRRFRALADELGRRLGRPVEIVTLNTYEGVLQDLKDRQVDFAFLGSLVVVLASDRLGAQIVAVPVSTQGGSTYRGIIVVRDDSPIRTPADLAGKSIALLRTTYAGDLFPVALLRDQGLLAGPNAVRIAWSGTHEQVVRDVVAGTTDAGAVKDTVLADLLRVQGDPHVRQIVVSPPVPNHAVVVRKDLAADLGRPLKRALLEMPKDDAGRRALQEFGAASFRDCSPDEFDAVYDMVERLGAAWEKLGIDGPPPARPAPAVLSGDKAGG